MRVGTLMHAGKHCPIVHGDTSMRDVIYEMSSKGLGMTCVVDGDHALLGIITDGDLRRHMARAPGILELTAVDVMTRGPVRRALRGLLRASRLENVFKPPVYVIVAQ